MNFYFICQKIKKIIPVTYFRIKNGGRGTKPTYTFMVIIPLLVIEPKATPIGNPSDNFYWRQKSSSLNLVQYNTTTIIHLCNIIPGLLLFTSKSI